MGWCIQSTGKQKTENNNNSNKKKTCQLKILCLAKLPFKDEGEVKTFPEKQNLKEFITTKQLKQIVITVRGFMKAQTYRRYTKENVKENKRYHYQKIKSIDTNEDSKRVKEEQN